MYSHLCLCFVLLGTLASKTYMLASGSRDRNILMRDVRVRDQFVATLAGHKQEVWFEYIPLLIGHFILGFDEKDITFRPPFVPHPPHIRSPRLVIISQNPWNYVLRRIYEPPKNALLDAGLWSQVGAGPAAPGVGGQRQQAVRVGYGQQQVRAHAQVHRAPGSSQGYCVVAPPGWAADLGRGHSR